MSNKFRRDHRQLSPDEIELVGRISQLAEELRDSIDMAPVSPAREHAQLKLQECVMWALKAIEEHR
jgi:hypothetical protein